MQKLTVLIDMDDVLENLSEVWIQILNERHGTSVQPEDIKEWDMTKAFPSLTRDEVFMPLYEEPTWMRVTPRPGAQEAVTKLKEDGHELIVVTASHPNTVRYKLNHVLFKYFPEITYDQVVITSKKQLICGDVLIDDNPSNLEGAAYAGILMTQPHNLSYNIRTEWIKRAHTWGEAYELVHQLSEYGV